jgi:hypothetical protein
MLDVGKKKQMKDVPPAGISCPLKINTGTQNYGLRFLCFVVATDAADKWGIVHNSFILMF